MTLIYRFIASEATNYPAVILCQLLGVSRSGYYAWKERPVRQDPLAPKVKEVFWFHSHRYGSRRIAARLRRKAVIGRHRVQRLMREQDLHAIQPQRFVPRTTDSNHGQRMSPNLLLERAIKVDRPQQVEMGMSKNISKTRRPKRVKNYAQWLTVSLLACDSYRTSSLGSFITLVYL